MRGRMSRRASNPPVPEGSNGGDSGGGYSAAELHEISAIVGRAARSGIDPERVLVALGVDPLSLLGRSRGASEARGPGRTRH